MMEIREKDLHADFYENGNKPLAVVFGGSSPGIPEIGKELMDYLKSNYNVLVLAYFGVEGLPKTLERAPLEYAVQAIDRFKRKLNLSDNDVALIGNSKGGELALLLASKYLRPRAAVACVPSCYVWQGIPGGFWSVLFPKSSWTVKGKDIPYVPFRYTKQIWSDIKQKIFRTCSERSIAMLKDEKALINLGRFQGKLLLLSSENDRYWPSQAMCDKIVETFKIDVTHKTLDLEGHYFLKYDESSREIIDFLSKELA